MRFSLIKVVIPNKVTRIEGYAFKGCTSLKDVRLGTSVTTIKESAFHTCTALERISIPASVKTIGEYCFAGCQNVWVIVFDGDAPVIGDWAFKNINARAYYPENNSTWTSDKMQNYGGSIDWLKNIVFEPEEIE